MFLFVEESESASQVYFPRVTSFLISSHVSPRCPVRFGVLSPRALRVGLGLSDNLPKAIKKLKERNRTHTDTLLIIDRRSLFPRSMPPSDHRPATSSGRWPASAVQQGWPASEGAAGCTVAGPSERTARPRAACAMDFRAGRDPIKMAAERAAKFIVRVRFLLERF